MQKERDNSPDETQPCIINLNSFFIIKSQNKCIKIKINNLSKQCKYPDHVKKKYISPKMNGS